MGGCHGVWADHSHGQKLHSAGDLEDITECKQVPQGDAMECRQVSAMEYETPMWDPLEKRIRSKSNLQGQLVPSCHKVQRDAVDRH